jgi:uncharacterized membrane protein (UPF0127 family)
MPVNAIAFPRRWRVGLLLGLMLIALLPQIRHDLFDCKEVYRQDKQLIVKERQLLAQEVSGPEEVARGLGGRKCMQENQAMLFSFSKSGNHCFWMKGMKFNLDMIWLNERKEIVTIQSKVTPESYPQTFCPSEPSLYVVEVNEGFAGRLKLQVGESFWW